MAAVMKPGKLVWSHAVEPDEDDLKIDLAVAGRQIFVTDNGDEIECQLCKSSGCRHVGKVISDNMDAEVVMGCEEFEVPISIQHSLWVRMGTREVAGSKLVFIHPVHTFVNEDEVPRELGLISPWEGRRVVRSMLTNLMMEWSQAHKPVHCPAKSHGPKQEKIWKELTNREKYIEVWSLLTVGSCRACNEWSGFDTFSDLNDSKTSATFPRINQVSSNSCQPGIEFYYTDFEAKEDFIKKYTSGKYNFQTLRHSDIYKIIGI